MAATPDTQVEHWLAVAASERAETDAHKDEDFSSASTELDLPPRRLHFLLAVLGTNLGTEPGEIDANTRVFVKQAGTAERRWPAATRPTALRETATGSLITQKSARSVCGT